MRQQSDLEKDELYKQIGQMKVELDFLKKEPAALLNTNACPRARRPRCESTARVPRSVPRAYFALLEERELFSQEPILGNERCVGTQK